MIINKLVKKWLQGESLEGSYLISVGKFKGETVLFIDWPQGRDHVLTYIREQDFNPRDPAKKLFTAGVDPDWATQDRLPVGYQEIQGKPYLISWEYRLNTSLRRYQ